MDFLPVPSLGEGTDTRVLYKLKCTIFWVSQVVTNGNELCIHMNTVPCAAHEEAVEVLCQPQSILQLKSL